MLRLILYSSFSILVILSSSSCKKDHFSNNPKDLAEFSVDTLSFDTVFTTIGSATQYFKIYNRKKDFIKISSLKLGAGDQSHFRLNVDGISGNNFTDIELRPMDSIYVFCEVKINPMDPLITSPFIILDSIVMITNTSLQKVYLDARGQNANYFPSKSNKGQIANIDLQSQTLHWDDPKPYVIYGIVIIDNGVLEIAEGARIHFFGGVTQAKDGNGNTFFYNDGRLIIGSNANIKIKGSKERPVIFEGVRLEAQYKELAGQWSGVFIEKYSKGNELNYTHIKNNLIGVFFDSLSEGKINQCIFTNNSYNGISAYSSTLEVTNCLFYNQDQASVSIQCGGNYVFNYCSLISLGNSEPSCFASNYFCVNPPFCDTLTSNHLQANFTNCIFTGSNSDEFYISKLNEPTVQFNLKLDHCLLRIQDLIKLKAYPNFINDYTTQCYFKNNLDSMFKDISKNDFRPDSLSYLFKKAKVLNQITIDLIGNTRKLQTPDLGCYESQY